MHQTYNNIIILKTQRPPRFFIERFTIFNCMLDIKVNPIFHFLILNYLVSNLIFLTILHMLQFAGVGTHNNHMCLVRQTLHGQS